MCLTLPNCTLENGKFHVIYILTTILKNGLGGKEATSPSGRALCGRQHTAPWALTPTPCLHAMPALTAGQAGASPGSFDLARPAFASQVVRAVRFGGRFSSQPCILTAPWSHPHSEAQGVPTLSVVH